MLLTIKHKHDYRFTLNLLSFRENKIKYDCVQLVYFKHNYVVLTVEVKALPVRDRGRTASCIFLVLII